MPVPYFHAFLFQLLTCIFCPVLALWLIKFQFDEDYLPVDTRQKIELRVGDIQ